MLILKESNMGFGGQFQVILVGNGIIVTILSSFTRGTNFEHSRFTASGVGLDIPLERRIPS